MACVPVPPPNSIGTLVVEGESVDKRKPTMTRVKTETPQRAPPVALRRSPRMGGLMKP